MTSENTFKAVLVGCGGMGRNQARILANHEDFTLAALCDLDADAVKEASAELGVTAYTDFAEMLEKEQPAVVAVPTSSAAHAPLTLQAARCPSVRGIYCEKPMATSLKDAKAMVDACRAHDIVLAVNHQRRLGDDLVKAKQLIDDGAIGDLRTLRGNCAGDFLSDGTHLCDSLLFLAGDSPVQSVVGQIVRDLEAIRAKWARMDRPEPPQGFGYRYGHAVESGAMGVIVLENGLRLELFTGDLQQPGRTYQDYVVEGTSGSLWRTTDRQKPNNLFIRDARGGSLLESESGTAALTPVPGPDGKGPWRPVEYTDATERERRSEIVKGYSALAHSLRTGEAHPMSGDIALNGFHVVMGIYESARLGKRLTAPFEVDRFPLEIMIEEGRA